MKDRHDRRRPPADPIGRLTGTTTVPMKWPEQSLKLISRYLARRNHHYKSYGTATQMIVNVPRVAAAKRSRHPYPGGHAAHPAAAGETDLYALRDVKSLPPDFKQYLSPSPLIESNHARIKAIAKQLGEGQTKAWPHVRAIYDWVRQDDQVSRRTCRCTGCVEAIDKQAAIATT